MPVSHTFSISKDSEAARRRSPAYARQVPPIKLAIMNYGGGIFNYSGITDSRLHDISCRYVAVFENDDSLLFFQNCRPIASPALKIPQPHDDQ
jgi:hypothetical protein